MNDIRFLLRASNGHDYEPVTLRNGHEAVIYTVAAPVTKDSPYIVHGYCPVLNLAMGWRKDGSGCISEYDIILPKKKFVRYLNIYESTLDGNKIAVMSYSAGDCEKVADPSRIACIRIEFTEGQFDE